MRALSALVVLAALAASAPHAQSLGDVDGTFTLLRLDPSARVAALGGVADVLTANPDDTGLADPAVALYNPALLTPASHRALGVSYLDHQLDIRAGFATYARNVRGVGTVGAAVRFLSYGDFERADEAGQGDGSTFGGSDTAVTLAVSRPLATGFLGGSTLRGGVSLTAAFAGLDDASARLFAADLGVAAELPGPAVVVGVAVRNLPLAFDALGADEDAPAPDLRVSVAKRLRYIPLTVAVTGYDLQNLGATGDGNALRHLNAGGELRLGRAISARAGYNFRRHDDLSTGTRLDLAGLTAGFGLSLRRIAIDYAYHGWSGFGGLHQFAVRTRL
ncbi:MAG TPA: PorV/PorQ family protein [Rhodothermales bacterium]|nr:PorV/PorQ family protein [Rhodothermales bacterium]